MYEELYAPLPDAAAYLKRIGLKGEMPEPTEEWLDRLVHAQLTHIPFDAMDVWGRGDTPSLAIEDLFDKIILRHRGGYCFELNSLFCAFLKALGYDAYLVTIHLLREGSVPPPAHCAVICVIEGEKYFCDVGYGGPVPDGCVKYDGQVYHGYRVVRDGEFHCLELVGADGGAQRVMLYQDAAILPVDMIPMNFHVSQRPGSFFRALLNVNLRLPDGSVWINGKHFSRHTSTERIDRELRDVEDLKQVLEQHFGIPADDPPLHDLDLVI